MQKIVIIIVVLPLIFLVYSRELINTKAQSTEDINTSVAPGTEWQNVPGNALYNTEEFSVMQFEAKYDCTGDGLGDTAEACGAVANSGFGLDHRDIISFDPDKVVSTAEGAPIVHISLNQAENACPAGTYLIKNDEWMTITRNAELQSANWIDDVVGSTITGLGGLKRGNVCVIDGVSYDGENPEYGTSRDEKSKIILSNGTEIWDLSGNVWEHLRIDDADSVIPRVNMPTLSTTADDGTSGGWGEFTDIDGYGMLSYDIIRPLDSSYNSTHGVGRI